MPKDGLIPINSGSPGEKPSVSIGLPVYNGQKYLREAMDSLLAQTFRNFELVVSDNASTDETEAICREYAARDGRIRYVRQTSNLGALGNFQYVLDAARGEYFMWAAHDDVWDVRWIERLLEELTRSGCDACFGTVRSIDGSGCLLRHPANERLLDFSGCYWLRRSHFFVEPECLGQANLFYSLFRTRALRSISIYQYPTDYLILFDFLKRHRIRSIKSVCLFKRIHTESIGANMRSHRKRSILHYPIGMARVLLSPLRYRIVAGYLSNAWSLEKVLLLLLLPARMGYSYFVVVHTRLAGISRG